MYIYVCRYRKNFNVNSNIYELKKTLLCLFFFLKENTSYKMLITRIYTLLNFVSHDKIKQAIS